MVKTNKVSSLAIEALIGIRTAMSDRDRRLAEFEERIEPERRALKIECENDILVAIAKARQVPGLSKRKMMEAARAQNWDRWKMYEERTEPLITVHKMGFSNEFIERELTWDEIGELNVTHFGTQALHDPDTNTFSKPPAFHAFKMRGLKFPHDTIRKDNPGNDVIVYWEDRPLTDMHWERLGNNPCWAVQDSAPVGEAREQIVKAIQEWLGKTP